jgi:hypothetical protein
MKADGNGMFSGGLIGIGIDSSPPFKSQRRFCEDPRLSNLYSATTCAFKVRQSLPNEDLEI